MAEPVRTNAVESRLKTTSTIVELVKNLALLLGFVFVFISARGAIRTVFHRVEMGDDHVDSVKVDAKGVELHLTEVKKQLNAALNETAKSSGKEDHPATGAADKISAAIAATNAALTTVTSKSAGPCATADCTVSPPNAAPVQQDQQRWVYLGNWSGSRWKPNYFNLRAVPNAGMNITASTDVYKRDARPVFAPTPADKENWNLGKAVGVLHEGASTSVLEVMNIKSNDGTTDWWARIS